MADFSLRLAALAVLFFYAGRGWCAEPREELRVARLIKRLGSDSSRDRAAASAELSALGSAGRPQLEQAVLSSDPEVGLRAKHLLNALDANDLWQPSHFTASPARRTTSQWVESLVARTGNHVRLGDPYGAFEDVPIELDLNEVPYWQALDAICALSGNRIRPHFNSREPGVAVAPGKPLPCPTAYSGPFRAQITQIARNFHQKLDFTESGSRPVHTFELDVQLQWEDRFQLVGYRSVPELVEAVTDGGVALAPTPSNRGGWHAANPTTRSLQARIALAPPPISAASIAQLKLRWGMAAVGHPHAVVIENPAAGQSESRDDLRLTIDSFEQREKNRCELCVTVQRDLVLPDPPEMLFQEYRLELFDADGKAWRSQSSTPVLTDRGAQLRMSFVRDQSQSDAKSLRLTYPALRSQRDLEIVFRDVPLPTARPE